MLETVDKMMLAGLGALSMTRERAEKLFDEYVQQGRKAREERSGFIKEILDGAEKTRAEFERIISEQVHQAIGKLDVASKEDLQRLEEKIDRLLKQEQ